MEELVIKPEIKVEIMKGICHSDYALHNDNPISGNSIFFCNAYLSYLGFRYIIRNGN